MTGDDFIILAGRLATSADEASLRSAVSRAYYGAFHLALRFLEDIERPVPKTRTLTSTSLGSFKDPAKRMPIARDHCWVICTRNGSRPTTVWTTLESAPPRSRDSASKERV